MWLFGSSMRLEKGKIMNYDIVWINLNWVIFKIIFKFVFKVILIFLFMEIYINVDFLLILC